MVALGRVRHDKMKDTQVLVSTLQRPHGATSSRIMSFSSSGKEAHLNTAVVAATKKRYETYKQATQLYFDVQRARARSTTCSSSGTARSGSASTSSATARTGGR